MSGIERFYSPPEIGAPGRREAKKRRRDLLITGVFTLAMLVALVLAIGFLFGLSAETVLYTTECPASGGVSAGTPILQQEYPIGQVVSVKPLIIDGKKAPPFILSLQIDRDWRVLPSDLFLIGSAGLLKGNVVNLVSVAKPESEVPELFLEQGGKLDCEIETGLMAKLDPIIESVRKQVTVLESFLVGQDTNSNNSQKTIAGILENLRSISDQLKQQMAAIDPGQVEAIVGSARATAKNVEQISATLNRRSAEIDHAVADFGELAHKLKRLVEKNDPKIERSLSDTQYLLQELASAMTPILNNLDETSENLKELSEDLRNNPASAIWGRTLPDNSPAQKP